MKRSLSFKLALAFILVSLGTGVALTLVFRSISSARFEQYVLDQQSQNKVLEMQAYYTQNQSWEGVEFVLDNNTGVMGGGMAGSTARPGQGRGQGSGSNQPLTAGGIAGREYGLADPSGVVLVGIEGQYTAGELLNSAELAEGAPIQVGDQVVGVLLAVKRSVVYSTAEQLFLDRVNRGLLITLGAVVLAAAIVGVLISRGLTRPVIELTGAARNLAAGQPNQQVLVNSQDELGELSKAFNSMSREIERSNQLRKQMTADVAHDLRTPLTVIGGYIDSMRVGDLEATPERLNLIYAEINRLNRLVTDLRLLSQSDAGELQINRQLLEPLELVWQVESLFRLQAEQKGIRLEAQVEESLGLISGDETRLIQVMENLVGNALRHTPAGGNILLEAKQVEPAQKGGSSESGMQNLGWLRFGVCDTGPGIPQAELGLVFERFHRADKSRHTEEDQSGLGLAIVKAIVEAHGGRAWAESQPGQGASFYFELPIAEAAS